MSRSGSPIRVLVVDDAVVVRRLLTTVIDAEPDLEVVGVAPNGNVALARIEQLKPDVVTLDIEMPELDGLATLARIRATRRDLPVIMFSTLTARGAESTLEALSLGASDYVTKPANVGSVAAAMDAVRDDLVPKIRSLCRPASVALSFPPMQRPVQIAPSTGRVEVVAIASSTGGPNALAAVLSKLPRDLGVPIVVTQHMPPVFTGFLAQRLDAGSALTVREARAGDLLEPGLVLVAPGDHHLAFRRAARGVTAEPNQAPAENWCRPAADVMLRSLVDQYGDSVLVAVLTGMGHDGRDGCALVRSKGGQVIAQDQATSVVWGMPGAVVTAGLADEVVPLDGIAAAITARVGSSRHATDRATGHRAVTHRTASRTDRPLAAGTTRGTVPTP